MSNHHEHMGERSSHRTITFTNVVTVNDETIINIDDIAEENDDDIEDEDQELARHCAPLSFDDHGTQYRYQQNRTYQPPSSLRLDLKAEAEGTAKSKASADNDVSVFDFDINLDLDEIEDLVDYSVYENRTGLAEDMKFLASMPELCDITFLVSF